MSNIRDLRVPSGLDVESATTHLTENRMLDDHTHDGSVKDKLYHLKSRGIEKLNSIKRDVNDRVATWKPVAQQRVITMRDGMKGRVSRVQSQMKANPAKWAGIAAGAGLGVGIIGRILRHRMRDSIPHIVVIERAC